MTRKYRKLSYVIAALVLDSIFFSLVNPRTTYAVVIIIGFGLLVCTLYLCIDLLLVLAERVVTFSSMTHHRLCVSATMLLGLLIAMQSIGQLTVKDLAAIVPLVLVAAFYTSYQRKQTR